MYGDQAWRFAPATALGMRLGTLPAARSGPRESVRTADDTHTARQRHRTEWTRTRLIPTILGMGVLPHIKKLDDALGHFLVQITCECGAQRIAESEALARLCGSSATLEAVGKRMRCSKCGTKGAEVVAVSIPRIRGRGFPR